MRAEKTAEQKGCRSDKMRQLFLRKSLKLSIDNMKRI